MSKFSPIADFFKSVAGSAASSAGRGIKSSKIGSIISDTRHGGWEQVNATSLNPENIHRWFNTRVFGKRVPGASPSYPMTTGFPTKGNSAFEYGWEANTGKMHQARELISNNYGKGLAVGAGVWTANRVDKLAGYAKGGPGHGGYIGYGEGHHSERNALQGARTNMNYQAQMMALQGLSASQIAPQYSFDIAPMRQRRASSALRNSTEGLAFGLHNGRHGGY